MKSSNKIYFLNIYALIVFILIFVEWHFFALEVNFPTHNIIGTVLKYIGEGVVVILPLYLFSGKWRRIEVGVIWTVSLLMLCNALYYRFWKDIMGVESLMLWKNVNTVLLRSFIGLLAPGDILFLIIPSLLTGIYIMKRKSIEARAYPRRMIRLGIVLSLFVAFLGSQITYAFAAYRYNKSVGFNNDFISVFTTRYYSPIFRNQFEYNNLGGLCFGIKSLCFVLKHHGTIKIEDRSGIDSFIEDVGRLDSTNAVISDSISAANSNKNLIVIIVESLNSSVIGRTVGDKKVTPVLDSLIRVEGSISSLNMITQVYKGGSSDGQMLINTGLLPLRTEAASMSFSDRIKMPSLAVKLKKNNNIAVFADDASSWKQREVYNNYGFNEIYCSSDFKDGIDKIGADAAMFRFGEQLIAAVKGSFCIEFVSISMHVPFKDPAVPMQTWLEDIDIPEAERNYLNVVNYFDNELGRFLNWLRDKGFYDNSMIVIVSDHSQTVNDTYGGDLYSEKMAFIAVNTGVTRTITTTTGQVNVYPTIVRLMEPAADRSGYRGLGRTLFDLALDGAVDPNGKLYGENADSTMMERAWQLSDSIIRGDYFKITDIAR